MQNRKESKHNTKYSHQITEGKTAKEEGTKETYKNNPNTMSKMSISTYLAIITLSVNGLNAPIKRYRLTAAAAAAAKSLQSCPTLCAP